MQARIFCCNSKFFFSFFILYGKAGLVIVRMVISGWLSIIVWCGAYGGKGIVGVWRHGKFYAWSQVVLFRTLLDWLSAMRSLSFFSIVDFLDLCNFCNWLFTLLYFLCTWVTCFPDLYNFITYQFLFLFLSVVFSSLLNSDDLLVGISWIMSFWSFTHIGWHNYCFIFHLLGS